MSERTEQSLPESLRQLLLQMAQIDAMRHDQGFEYTPTNMRESLDIMTRRFVTRIPEMPLIHDTLVHGPNATDYPVPIRIYHPSPAEALPALVFAHGGGHMAGSVSVYEAIARKLAIAAHRVLLSVDYRLSPECPFPYGLMDLKNVIRSGFQVLERLGLPHVRRLAVVGDSGGGAITATAVHQLADEPGIDIERQVLIYPSLDYTMSSASMVSRGQGYLLERKRIRWLFDQYFQHHEDRRKVSPLYMPLPNRYPATWLVTAEYCPLRDEGRAYVDRLRAAGFSVEAMHFPDMIHAFLNLEDLVADRCDVFYRGFGEFLRDA